MSSSRDRAVTVVIATRGLRERAASLRRAVDGVAGQTGVRGVPLVVLNGPARDPDVERSLRADARVRLVVREEASLPAATLAGRAAVDTPWFANLDDDDELLPGALALRVDALERDGARDVVVTNGFRHEGVMRVPNVPSGSARVVNADPIRALFRRNWLLPGSWLCRSDAVGTSVFEGMPRYLECTWLAARFATELRMLWLDEPTVVYRLGSPHAESRSYEYLCGQMDALRAVLALRLPDDVRRDVERRVGVAYHDASRASMDAGALGAAWRYHARSLLERRGWWYVPFTRHLVRASLRRRAS